VGVVALLDGRRGNVVLAGSRGNSKGAILVLPDSGGEVTSVPLAEGLDLLAAPTVVDILCMQERAFGDSGLEPPPGAPGQQ